MREWCTQSLRLLSMESRPLKAGSGVTPAVPMSCSAGVVHAVTQVIVHGV